MAEKVTTVNFKRFPQQLHTRLKRFAEREGRTQLWTICEALRQYLDKHDKKKKRR